MLNENNFENNSLLLSVKYILDFYFGEVDFKTISAFFIKGESFELPNAIEIFKNFNLSVIEKDIHVEAIAKHFLPSVILDDKNTPLLYLKRVKDQATLFDPKTKEEREVDIKTLKQYKKALLIFRDTKHIKHLEADEKQSWFYEPLKSHWRGYIEIGVLTLFINIFALAIPLFVMNIYNRVVPNGAYETLFVLASGTILVLIFDLILKYTRSHILEDISKKLGLFWEEELMGRMMLIDTQHDHYMSGTKANLFKELQQVRDFFTNRSLMQVIDFPFFVIALFVIYLISPLVALVPFLFALLIIGFNILMQKPILRLSKNSSENLQSKYSFIFESIQGTQNINMSNATASRMFLWRNIGG